MWLLIVVMSGAVSLQPAQFIWIESEAQCRGAVDEIGNDRGVQSRCIGPQGQVYPAPGR